MKREILCPGCCKEFVVAVGAFQAGDSYFSSTKYPGEFVRVRSGRSLVHAMCDHCGVDIQPGVECSALSIFTERLTYFPWEEMYLHIQKGGGKDGMHDNTIGG